MKIRPRVAIWFGTLSVPGILTGCGAGPMKVDERYYLAAVGPDNTNFYRVTLKANTEVGVAELRQGWFPASAVDALFGDVSSENGGRSLATREAIKNQTDEAILRANREFLAKATDVTVSDKELLDYSRARWRVRLQPGAKLGGTKMDEDGYFPSESVIEYNPQRGLELNRSDEKFVVVLASNPDAIVSQIRQFAAADNTKKTLTQFTDAVVQGRNQDVIQRNESLTVGLSHDKILVTESSRWLEILNKGGVISRDDALSVAEKALNLMGGQK